LKKCPRRSHCCAVCVSVHLNGHAVEEYADGFLLSEVVLERHHRSQTDHPNMLEAQSSRAVQLEMPARDPLKVPVLTKKYWITLKSYRPKSRGHAGLGPQTQKPTPLPRVSGLPMERTNSRSKKRSSRSASSLHTKR